MASPCHYTGTKAQSLRHVTDFLAIPIQPIHLHTLLLVRVLIPELCLVCYRDLNCKLCLKDLSFAA